MFVTIVEFLCLFSFVLPQECGKDFDIRLNTIILTRASERNGARFIRKSYADSLEECINACCHVTDCTVGVFGPKVPYFLQPEAPMFLLLSISINFIAF